MKKIVPFLLLLTCLLSTSIIMAQEDTGNKPLRARWYSEKGYWVVETSKQQPQNSLVHFYTNESKLIYTEQITGKVLKMKKRKTLMQLKNALEKIVATWETTGKVDHQNLLASQLKNN